MASQRQRLTGTPSGARHRFAALSLLALLGVAVLFWRFPRAPDPRVVTTYPRVAVLPFGDSTREAGRPDLALGLGSILTLRLGELGGLHVSSREEVWTTRNREQAISALARQLGVDALLTGEVESRGSHVRATLTLQDGPTGERVWSQEIEESSERLLDLETALAAASVRALGITLSRREGSRLSTDLTRSLKAFEYFLQGQRYLQDLRNPRGPDFAAELFTAALELDPDFALAYTDLGIAHWRRYVRDHDPEALSTARRAVDQATRLDPELLAAQAAMVRLLHRGHHKVGKPAIELHRLLKEHPKPGDVERELAAAYLQAGELEEAEECLNFALSIEPGDWRNWNALGQFLQAGGRFDEAEFAFEEAARLAPAAVAAPWLNLTAVRARRARPAGAIEAFAQTDGRVFDAPIAATVAAAYSALDRLPEAEHYLRQAATLQPDNFLHHGSLGDVLWQRGDRQGAIAEYTLALELLDEERDEHLPNSSLDLRRAFYAARSGRCTEALAQAAMFRRHLPAISDMLHDLALVFSICRDRDATLEALRTAIRSGLPPDAVRRDEEFAWLAEDDDFDRIVAEPLGEPPSP